jgi:group I intron endonuclease
MQKQLEIYTAENLITGKIYVGKSKYGTLHRKKGHETNCVRMTHLEHSIRKYGKENFKWTTIFICSTEQEMNEMEKFFIADYMAQYELYNHAPGGIGGDTFSLLSKEDKLKRIQNSTGKNNPMYGKSFYDIWAEKFGKEEADKRLNEFKEKCKLNMPSGNKHHAYENVSIEEIKKLRAQNKTMREIAKILNCSTMVIQDRLKRKTECKD